MRCGAVVNCESCGAPVGQGCRARRSVPSPADLSDSYSAKALVSHLLHDLHPVQVERPFFPKTESRKRMSNRRGLGRYWISPPPSVRWRSRPLNPNSSAPCKSGIRLRCANPTSNQAHCRWLPIGLGRRAMNCQSEVRLHDIEVTVRVEQRNTVHQAIAADDHVDGLAHGGSGSSRLRAAPPRGRPAA